MIYDTSLDDLLHKVWEGRRINPAEALRHELPLEVGALADRRHQLASRRLRKGNEIVTYIVDRNINYTHLQCYCKFCAYRLEGDEDAYVIRHGVDRKIEGLWRWTERRSLAGWASSQADAGGPGFAHTSKRSSQINIHGFSPSEFIHFREVFQLPLEEIISRFVKAGLGSIPGGGGEILVDRVRRRVSPLKAMSDDWLSVMDVAHRLGLNSTATMMFGHVETVEDRIEHLERVRAQQDKTHGFTAFIAWTFQAEHTKLRVPTASAHDTACRRSTALSG